MPISERIARIVVAAPKRLIAVLLLITLAFGASAYKIRILDDLTQVIPKESPVRQAMALLEDTFGPSETLVLMVRHADGSVFEADFLGKIFAFSTRLQEKRPLNRVQSLASVSVFERDEEGSLKPRPILAGAPTSASEVARIEADIRADADIMRAFVSADERHMALYVDPKKGFVDSDIIAAIREETEALAPYTLHLTGMPIVRDATTQAIRRDMAVMIPVVILVLGAFLAFTFRTVGGVVLTLVVVSLSILPGAGLMGLFGIPMTAINNTFPVLILAIACAGAIHILSLFYIRLRQGYSRDDAVAAVILELTLPVFLAALTTIAGFLSLLTSPIPPMGTLGWVVAVGVLWAWALTMFMLPAALMLLKPPQHIVDSEHRGVWFFDAVTKVSQRAPGGILAVVVLALSAIAYFGLPQLTRETRVERFFTADNVARADSEAIDAAFRGSTPLEIVVQEDVKRSDVLRKVDAFSAAVQRLDMVGSVDSIVNVVARIQEGFAGTREIPDDDFQISQSLFLYSLSAAPEQYQRFVATDEQSFRVTVRMPNLAPDELERAIEQINVEIDRHLAGLNLQVTGKALFLSELNKMVIRSALSSVAMSLVMVFIICLLTFRRLSAGFEGMTPLFVAVLAVFGIMGLVGVPLTIASALVSAIVIGVGVDYGIHVLSRWNVLIGTSFDDRVSKMIAEVGRPILLNAAAVGCGLGVLSLSQFQPIQQLGTLSVIAMVTAALAALFVIPALKAIRETRGDPK